jgi:hypothetical protein
MLRQRHFSIIVTITFVLTSRQILTVVATCSYYILFYMKRVVKLLVTLNIFPDCRNISKYTLEKSESENQEWMVNSETQTTLDTRHRTKTMKKTNKQNTTQKTKYRNYWHVSTRLITVIWYITQDRLNIIYWIIILFIHLLINMEYRCLGKLQNCFYCKYMTVYFHLILALELRNWQRLSLMGNRFYDFWSSWFHLTVFEEFE